MPHRGAVGKQILGWEQSQHAHQTARVIRVRVGQGHEVEAPDMAVPEHRRDDAGANVETPIVSAASVDQQVVIAGRLHQNRVARADVQKGDAQPVAASFQDLPARAQQHQQRTGAGTHQSFRPASGEHEAHQRTVIGSDHQGRRRGEMELRVRQAGDQVRKADEPGERVGKDAEDNGRRGGPQHQKAEGQHAGRYEEAGEGQQEQVGQDAEGWHRVERLHQDGQRAEIGGHACDDIRQQVEPYPLPHVWRRLMGLQDFGGRQQDGGHRCKGQPESHVGEGPRVDKDDEHGGQDEGVAGVVAPFDA